MSKILWRLLGVGLLGLSSGATASPCLPGTLTDYLALGSGCEIGSATFAGFELAPGQAFATPIDPSLILVTPGGTASDPALLFTLNVSATAGQLFESFFRFQVSIGSGASLAGARAVLGGASATEDGAALLVEDLCRGGTFLPSVPLGCTGTPDSLIAFLIASDSVTDVTTSFPDIALLDVFADLTADGGLSGTATFGSALLSFATTAVPAPEPPALPLAALALAVAAACARRRTHAAR